ncbi:MAG: hypothetical protein WKG06_08700 [Segetibacter sp.]
MKLINSSLDPNSYADTISETLEQVESEIGQRQVQKSKCKVFELSRTAENPFVPSGAVMAVIGIKGNETLKLIADALHKDDVRLVSEIRNVFGETHRKIQTLIEKGASRVFPKDLSKEINSELLQKFVMVTKHLLIIALLITSFP